MEAEKVILGYFRLIHDRLSCIKKISSGSDQPMDELKLLEMDLRFMIAFCFSLDTTTAKRMREFRFIIILFQVIWPESFSVSSLLTRAGKEKEFDVSIQDISAVISVLKEKIKQSKKSSQGWCEYLMHSSSMGFRSSPFFVIRYYLKHIRKGLKTFSSYRATEIVPLKKGIDILHARLFFLEESMKNVENCSNRIEIQQFLDCTLAFVNNSACLACLYWSKEDNEETATELNVDLFNMLQKFIPCVFDVIPLHIGILKSYDVQPSDSFMLGEAVESFVDFFFDHLDTILKDDFLLLRDRLTFLLTFLIDPPCENAEEEDIIRIQIHALFHEDEYLRLPFDKMKDDFLDKRILLGDCMIKIDTTIAKIRELYRGFTGSWIRLDEIEKMECIYFVSVQRELSWIEKHAQWVGPVLGQLQLYKTELRFLRLFLLCFTTWWDDADEEIGVRLNSMNSSLHGIWEEKDEEGLLAHRLHEIRRGDITNWHLLALELQGKIQLSKLEIEVWWVNLFHLSFRCKPLTTYKILKFLDSILKNLDDLVSYKAGEIIHFKKQIEIFKENVVFLKVFLKLTLSCIKSKNLDKFNMFVQVFAIEAACLTFLYWAKDANDKISSETNSMLSDMLQKIKPVTSDVARLYFETLEAIYEQGYDSLMFGQTIVSFVYLFLEDCFHILRDDIIFLLTFLNSPPDKNAKELVSGQIDVLFWEGLFGLLPFDDIEGDFSKKNVLLNDFMMRIETINANIRHAYCIFPDSSLYNFPKIISPQFLDFLIHNLRNLKERLISERTYAPFAKYIIIKIEEELVSLGPFFNHMFDLQSEENESWLEVVNLLHLTEHVINSCISSRFIFDHPIWYHMAYLSDILGRIEFVRSSLEKIKKNTTAFVRSKLEKVKENTTSDVRHLHGSPGFIRTPTEQARPSEANEIIVGFDDNAETIIQKLTRGKSFDIVSIVGMGGLGKTTLAKMVYGSSTVKQDFNVFAFCYVSQDHNIRRLLLDILCDIIGTDYGLSDMTRDDLAHRLRKSLSRQKYLIVLDDIWDINVWNEVKSSFPDDKNGSKVLITTRSHEVANDCKIYSIPFELNFLSDVESWELFQKKVFDDGIAPPYLYDIGMLIAKNCKGLPLAVIVIAGLLGRTKQSLSWWNEVSERLFSYISEEGCMRILELSYEHLPKNLKPCLLYLGAFPEDKLIEVKHVILLWIAEGFVQESKTKSVEDVAKLYIQNLADRSLIIIQPRSSNGEIKTFRVHDLVHDLCRTKCVDRNFFHLNHGIAQSSTSSSEKLGMNLYRIRGIASSTSSSKCLSGNCLHMNHEITTSSDPLVNNQYRVSTQKQNIDAGSSHSNAHSLLYFGEQGYDRGRVFPIGDLRLAQVLDLDLQLQNDDLKQLTSLVHLRHIHAKLAIQAKYIPSSISNLWNIQSFMLTSQTDVGEIHLPITFWGMKTLKHVKIDRCILKLSEESLEHEAYPKLDNVVSFSKPCLSTGNDVQQLLQRLPSVKRLSCFLKKCNDNLVEEEEESIETLDFHRKLESLKLTRLGKIRQYLINFPSTLMKLTLVKFQLSQTAISAIAELHCLQSLKLRSISFPELVLDMENLVFRNLKFFELHSLNLVVWNASIESLPCLYQLVIECTKLEELPPCFEEIPTLKKIMVKGSKSVKISALGIKEEQIQLGNHMEVSISIRKRFKIKVMKIAEGGRSKPLDC